MTVVLQPFQKPFLSICITSYNRVHELYRCLKSIDTVYEDMIEIVISEDCSPKKDEIAEVVRNFIAVTRYPIIYHTNINNLGYDRNLGKLIELAHGKYILFLSDDDALCENALDRIIDELRDVVCAVAFSPFIIKDTGSVERKFAKTMLLPQGLASVKKFINCAILFSGLIFKRELITGYAAEKFKNLIYFQVYLFATVLYRNDGYYIDEPLIQLINDGENAFGISESSEKNSLLADRKSIYSNLEYHKGLIKCIRIFDDENKTDLMESFSREYSIRAYGGMSRACRVGRKELSNYWAKMKSLDIELSIVARLYYWFLKILGYKICDVIFRVPKTVLLGVRKRIY